MSSGQLIIGGREVKNGDAIALTEAVAEISVTLPTDRQYQYTVVIFRYISQNRAEVHQFLTNLLDGQSRQVLASPLVGPPSSNGSLGGIVYFYRLYRHILLVPNPTDLRSFVLGGILSQVFVTIQGVVLTLVTSVEFTLYLPLIPGPNFEELVTAAPDGGLWSFLCDYRLLGDGPWPATREDAQNRILSWYRETYQNQRVK